MTERKTKNTLVRNTIIFLLVSMVAVNLGHHRYNKPDRVIEWDIKSYYAYLPAAIIHQDLALDFRNDDFEKYSKLIWPLTLPSGNKVLIYTMGMAFLYSPFFLIAHGVAHITQWEADGYSRPYRFALTFSAMFYVWMGLVFLARILRRFFSEKAIAITLFSMVAGTNLLYYATYEAPMTHAFNFSLIVVFIWQTVKFYDNPTLAKIIGAGAMAGLITLIRPTNILVLLLFFLWDIKSWDGFRERINFFLKRYYWVMIMAAFFVLIWVPQFIYWYRQTGQIFFFSYGVKSERFYFLDPQIFNILFSYRKGWLLYTPLMIFAFAGLFYLKGKPAGLILPIVLFKVISIYILSTWWSWWYGGSFGSRTFIDFYGLMAIPFAAITDAMLKAGKIKMRIFFTVIPLLILFNLFQTWQYTKNFIHWDSMGKKTYWMHFLRVNPHPDYWPTINQQNLEYREIRKQREERWSREDDK